MKTHGWLVFALLGALFAGMVNVLSKKALDAMNFMTALCVQGVVILLTLLTLTTLSKKWGTLADAPRWAIGMMALAGVASGFAWFFGYRALQMSDVGRATPVDKLSMPIAVFLALIFLPNSKPSVVNWIGIAMMFAGAIFVAQSNGPKT